MTKLVKGTDIKRAICANFYCGYNFGECGRSYVPECGLSYCASQLCGNAKAMPYGNSPKSN